jgi:two-component system, cell cycle response regulator DivK
MSAIDGKKVVVIEDNALNMKLFSRILAREGFHAVGAETAEEGLKLLKTVIPSLVLMDIRLPGMDGLQATRIIKADPATAGIPVIAVSAYAMEEDLRQAREAGCDAFVTKPIDMKNFVETVRKMAL